MKTNNHFRKLLVAASAGALLTGTSAFANHEVETDISSSEMAHPSAELRTDTHSSFYDPAGSEVRVYDRDMSRGGMSAGFNSEMVSDSDLNAQADRILRMYQKGKMPAEITDREYHQVNGQTLFPRFQAYRGDADMVRTERYHHAKVTSKDMVEPAGASVEISHNSNLEAPSAAITTAPATSTASTNDWQKGYFNSQSNRGAEIKDPAGADISVRATQSPALAPAPEVKTSISTDSNTSLSGSRSDLRAEEPSVHVTTSPESSLSNSNSQLGGINNQNKDSIRLGDKNAANRVNESSDSLKSSSSSDLDLKATSDASASGGVNNQTKDSQKASGSDSTVKGDATR
jgi:hypothetical protein